jgi:3-hydroxyacyl-[acyl-carrier-protein] dehydratase
VKPADGDALRLGADAVQRLIPHRRPLLMVDGVLAYRHGARPALWAHRHISSNEPVFDGHFPGLHLWPGIYTIEALGQTALLCAIVMRLVLGHEATGGTPDEVYRALRNLERPAPRSADPSAARDAPLAAIAGLGAPDPRAGVAGHIDVKLLAPVFAGSELRTLAVLTHQVDSLARFDVTAEVDGKPVARGTLTGALGTAIAPSRIGPR